MQFTDIFVRRPVLAIVVSLLILIAGLQAVSSLSVRQYPRNDNANPAMFWLANAAILVAAGWTLKHDPNSSSRGLQLLSRNQTEEWKGWMQFAFIMVRGCVVHDFFPCRLAC